MEREELEQPTYRINGDQRLLKRERQRFRLTELARASNSFGLDLYSTLVRDLGDENVVFSPLSVFTALSMTVRGTQGQTKQELKVKIDL